MLFVSHKVLIVLEQKGGHWLTEGCMGKYQAILLDNPKITLQCTTTLNLATLLPDTGRLSPPAWLLRNH